MSIRAILDEFPNWFPEPYLHETWLAGQEELITRLRLENDEYLTDMSNLLQKFQDENQVSPVMVEIIADRITKHRHEKNADDQRSSNSNPGGQGVHQIPTNPEE